VIACSADVNDGSTPYRLTCHVTSGSYGGGDVLDWSLDGASYGSTSTWTISDSATHHVRLYVGRTGTNSVSSNVVSGSAGSW
jgi:hypothetical protein